MNEAADDAYRLYHVPAFRCAMCRVRLKCVMSPVPPPHSSLSTFQGRTTMCGSWAPSTESCWSPTPRWPYISTATLWWTCSPRRPTAASWCWRQVRRLQALTCSSPVVQTHHSGPELSLFLRSRLIKNIWSWHVHFNHQSCFNLCVFLLPDQKPDVMYADIGGMDIQKQEVREAVELPLTHFELYKQVRYSSDIFTLVMVHTAKRQTHKR